MVWLLLFVFGIAMGSFLNVVAVRYDGDHFLLSEKTIGGRSHCPHCKKTLRWFELVPLVSFIMLGGKCARCDVRIGFQYPLVELVSGLVFALVPYRVETFFGLSGAALCGAAALWVVIFEALLVMALIDVRLGIIPDELSAFLAVLAVFFGIFTVGYLGLANVSLISFYGPLFGLQQNFWLNHIFAGLFAGAFFGLLILCTRGKGMGMGDLKLAIPLGLIFGWPDILLIIAFANVIGAIVGLAAVVVGKKTIHGTIPFGPFLAMGALTTFFFAYPLFQWYFSIIGLH
jgi:prepilin signal peptidase PulO-like enzyme (type II secretory pathway)